MSITGDFDKAMDDAAVSALRNIVVNKPSTSIADLRELLAAHPSLGGVTLTDLFGGAPAKRGPKPGRGRTAKAPKAPAAAAGPGEDKAKKAAAPKAPKARDRWDTRTAEGRAALDAAVLEGLAALGRTNVSAESLRDRIGATPHQLRASLNRHIAAGDVSFTGKARGTRYSLE